MNNISNYINETLDNTNFFEGELKVGYLKNDIFNYNINNSVYYGFKNFIEKNNNANKIKQKIYHHFDMMLISKDENSHVCFKLNETHMEYYTPIQNKLSLRFKKYNNNIIDNLNFPCLDSYHNYEDHEIDRYSINYNNSIINIDFININNDVKSIIFKFKVESANIDNFKINLQYVLSKFYRKKINL
jgi:hypothetical protein